MSGTALAAGRCCKKPGAIALPLKHDNRNRVDDHPVSDVPVAGAFIRKIDDAASRIFVVHHGN